MEVTRSIFALWVTVLVVATAAGQSTGTTVRHYKVPDSPTVAPELTQAENDIEKQNYAAAEPLLRTVVASDANNYQAWFDLGFVCNAIGKTQESIEAYKRSVAAKADVFESNLNLGLMLAKAGQPGAEEYLRAATVLKPTANGDEGHARAWLSLAHVLESSKPDEAITAYQNAANLQPRDIEPHLSAGQLLEKQNRFADAEQEYKKALTIDPNSTDALTGLANIAMRAQEFAEAEDVLHKLVSLHPDNAAAHLQLGRLMAAAGHDDDAVHELQTAMKLAPGDLAAQRDLADIYAADKKYDLAAAQYREILAGKPNDADLHHALGISLLKQNKYADALQEFLITVKLAPNDGPAYWDMAVAADGNKDYPLALRAVDARAQLLPETALSYFLRATAYDHLRAFKPASENYHKFLDAANGKYPDQEWQARHRLIAIEPKK
jgi:tetratricopeptide (TPR) repeat protein